MSEELRDFEQFMKRREAAAGAYVSGDAAPLGGVVSHTSPATFFGPQGDYCEGAKAVATRYGQDATAFAPGSDNRFEILHMAASDGIAYWVGFQRASARMRGQEEAVPFNLRVTELYRREGGEWKLVHRHADALKVEADKQR